MTMKTTMKYLLHNETDYKLKKKETNINLNTKNYDFIFKLNYAYLIYNLYLMNIFSIKIFNQFLYINLRKN